MLSPRSIRASNSAMRCRSSAFCSLGFILAAGCFARVTAHPAQVRAHAMDLLNVYTTPPRGNQAADRSRMTDNGHVETHVNAGVGTVSFFHPKGNSLPAAILAELAGAVKKLGDDSGVKVIVMKSEGDGAFCAGASFTELQAIADEAA